MFVEFKTVLFITILELQSNKNPQGNHFGIHSARSTLYEASSHVNTLSNIDNDLKCILSLFQLNYISLNIWAYTGSMQTSILNSAICNYLAITITFWEFSRSCSEIECIHCEYRKFPTRFSSRIYKKKNSFQRK